MQAVSFSGEVDVTPKWEIEQRQRVEQRRTNREGETRGREGASEKGKEHRENGRTRAHEDVQYVLPLAPKTFLPRSVSSAHFINQPLFVLCALVLRTLCYHTDGIYIRMLLPKGRLSLLTSSSLHLGIGLLCIA